MVGSVTLLLLDANIPDNAPAEREITARLYGGDRETRIRQELLLGIGGLRALDAAGISADRRFTSTRATRCSCSWSGCGC